MGQIFSFAAPMVPPSAALGARSQPLPVDPEVRNLGDITGPEAPLAVEFVGISEAEQQAALAAFPGGQRFRLVTSRAEAV